MSITAFIKNMRKETETASHIIRVQGRECIGPRIHMEVNRAMDRDRCYRPDKRRFARREPRINPGSATKVEVILLFPVTVATTVN